MLRGAAFPDASARSGAPGSPDGGVCPRAEAIVGKTSTSPAGAATRVPASADFGSFRKSGTRTASR